ncbi:MAG: hypothetical protein M0R51_08605 [Clostridia bacterium]|jgi:hypothetical protein|nr:hypothetical protein [Clostridia bacterium]
MGFKKEEDQYQASNQLFLLVKKYLKDNKLKFSEFCEQNNLPEYITRKVLNRSIKMHIFPAFIMKIARCINIYKYNFCTRYYKLQPTSQAELELMQKRYKLSKIINRK